jgi:hypothetical protein
MQGKQVPTYSRIRYKVLHRQDFHAGILRISFLIPSGVKTKSPH